MLPTPPVPAGLARCGGPPARQRHARPLAHRGRGAVPSEIADDAGPGGAGPASGMLAAPGPGAVSGRITDEALTSALSSEALTSKLIGDMLASLPPSQPPPARKSRRHLAPLIP